MKRGIEFRALLVGMGLLCIILAAGCAGKGREAGDERPLLESPRHRGVVDVAKGNEARPKNEILEDDKGAFEVVPTPLGSVKRRVEEESESAGTERQPVTQAKHVPLVKIPERQKKTHKGPGRIVLNFDDADLYEVIKTIAELLEINYIVDPGIRGKVTIHTARKLSKEDLFPVFLQILEVNGLTAIEEGSLYKIVRVKDSPRMPIDSRFRHDEKDIPLTEKIIIQIIPLKFISTQEMTKLVTPFISSGGTIVSDVASNTLLVVDKGINILKILRLVQTFDINMFERVYYKFYPLKYLDAADVSKILGNFTDSYGKLGNILVKFIAIERLNTVFAVSTTPLVFEKIEDILSQIDVVDEEIAPRIYVYFVKNGTAEDLAGLLDGIFQQKGSGKEKDALKKKKAGGSSALRGNPFSKARMKEKRAKETAAETKPKETSQKTTATVKGALPGTGTLMGKVNITPDEVRNALIIEAIPADYRVVENILRQIDVLPRQVLIEATIAEIKLDSSTSLGMEWAFGKGAAAAGTGSFAAAINKVIGTGTNAVSTGLTYSIGVADKWYAALHALASEGKVNIISSPHVLASDGKEARIDVSREIPIASGTTNIVSSTTVAETTIEYRDTGVLLSVTPHINDRGLVTMDISEEVSELEKEVEVAGKKYPSFFKRTVNTTLTVKHGQTIVIGGLIRDKEEEHITGVPCLIKIPVLRYVFGQWSKSVEKIELIVLITPRVVANLDDVDAVTQEFKQKVRNVVDRFYPQ